MTKKDISKKKLMLDALKKRLGVVSRACRDIKISRQTHYNWMDLDLAYREEVSHISDEVIDFAEDNLFKLIKKGNVTAIIFFLKTRGRHRGYNENVALVQPSQTDPEELKREEEEYMKLFSELPNDVSMKLMKFHRGLR